MTSRLALKRSEFFPHLYASETLNINRLSATSFRFAMFLWEAIGRGATEDRAHWYGAQWQHYLADPRCEFYAVYCDGEPAGCVEIVVEQRLMRTAGGSVRLKAFGLLPEFEGDEISSAILTRIAEKAFAKGAMELTLRTGEVLPDRTLLMFRQQGFRVLSTAG
jgi:GNAT superfamily N-acetyltransferase